MITLALDFYLITRVFTSLISTCWIGIGLYLKKSIGLVLFYGRGEAVRYLSVCMRMGY